MSGHSKWSTIKRKKAVLDSKRGQEFTKLARAITIAARGGEDMSSNPSLRLAVSKAKKANMPNSNIEKALERGNPNSGEGNSLVEFTLEGYGPFGVAILIEAITDNKNRTVGDIRSIMTRGGGSMGIAGCSAYIFENREVPLFTVELESGQSEKVLSVINALGERDDVQNVYHNLVTI